MIKSWHDIKYTEYVFLAAVIPIEVAKWVLPTPLGPTKSIFSCLSKNPRVLSSKISCLLKLLTETNVLQTAIQKGYLDEYKSQTLINIAEGLGYKIDNE